MEIRINKIEKFHIQVENKDVQDVHYAIWNGDEKLASRRENFPLDADETTIKEKLLAAVKAFDGEVKQSAEEAEKEKAESVTKKNAEKLVGKKLKA